MIILDSLYWISKLISYCIIKILFLQYHILKAGFEFGSLLILGFSDFLRSDEFPKFDKNLEIRKYFFPRSKCSYYNNCRTLRLTVMFPVISLVRSKIRICKITQKLQSDLFRRQLSGNPIFGPRTKGGNTVQPFLNLELIKEVWA